MKYAHYIELRVFCKEEDSEKGLIKKIKEFLPLDFEKEKIMLEIKTAYGFEDKKIRIITLGLKKQKHTSLFLKNLFKNLGDEQKELLLKQIDSRLDENLHFYIRLDKDKLLSGEYWITDSGNCFHIKITIAAYPHTKSAAKKIISRLLLK